MNVAPRSKEFDDVYFSAVDGLAETQYVFLAGNGLPGRWAGKERFVIAETGFGTGLNFLAVWKLFAETAQAGQSLEFISFEKYPLSGKEIGNYLLSVLSSRANARDLTQDYTGSDPSALTHVRDDNGVYEGYLAQFLDLYPKEVYGVRTLSISDRVILKIYFGDVNEEIAKVETPVDCWFLDGFKPATNPEMWTDTVFANMARLSAPGASFATFTAAGAVKRGLRAAGFDVRKVKGFGTKRDMLVGEKI